MYSHLAVFAALLLLLCASLWLAAREEGGVRGCGQAPAPKPPRKVKYHVPKFMLDLYEKNKRGADGGAADVSPDVVRSVLPKHAGTLSDVQIVETLTDKHLLIFDLPLMPADERFIGAELKIFTLIDSKYETGVRRTIKISTFDDFMERLSGPQEIEILHFNNSWLSFNLTSAVAKMLRNDNRRLKIFLAISRYVSDFKNSLKLSLAPLSEDLERDYPVLLLSYASERKVTAGRRKRSLEDDYEEESNRIWELFSKRAPRKAKRLKNSCKRKPLYVDFGEIDYDVWIVQPKGYEAYQCQGKCYYPVAEHLNPTKHAIVQALVHSVAPSKATRSCCVPTALDSISILYVDERGVLTYRYAYKDMVVVECGCR